MLKKELMKCDIVCANCHRRRSSKMYGGCRVNVAIKPWLQENKHGRGIRADLVAVQFAGDDKAFGEGAVDASGMFGAVAGAAAPAPSFLQPAAAQMPLPPFMSAQ